MIRIESGLQGHGDGGGEFECVRVCVCGVRFISGGRTSQGTLTKVILSVVERDLIRIFLARLDLWGGEADLNESPHNREHSHAGQVSVYFSGQRLARLDPIFQIKFIWIVPDKEAHGPNRRVRADSGRGHYHRWLHKSERKGAERASQQHAARDKGRVRLCSGHQMHEDSDIQN